MRKSRKIFTADEADEADSELTTNEHEYSRMYTNRDSQAIKAIITIITIISSEYHIRLIRCEYLY